jgi:hypothetical protein
MTRKPPGYKEFPWGFFSCLFTGFTNQANTNVEAAFHLMETGNVIRSVIKKEAPLIQHILVLPGLLR